MQQLVINPGALARQLSELVRLPSVTPLHAGARSGSGGEGNFAQVMVERCESLGAEVHVDMVMPGRPNVMAIWRGQNDGWLGVDVHSDTVGVEGMQDDPFDGRVADGRVYGRGSVDTKATLAVCLTLLEAMMETGQRPWRNVLLAMTCDEEGTSKGAPALANWLNDHSIWLDQIIVAEPTRCAPVHGHKGVLRQVFEIEGVAAHSAQPERGRNAVTAAAHVALAFEAEHCRLQAAPSASPLGKPTLTVSQMEGGQGPSVVPDKARLTIDRRLVSGESAAVVDRQYRALAAEASALPVYVTTTHGIDAFYQSPNSPLVEAFSKWTATQPLTVPYCTNAWAYEAVAHERIVIGPGSIDQAHGEVEWVAVDELVRMAQAIAHWWSEGA